VRDIRETLRNLTEWEKGYMNSIYERVEMGWYISPKRIETIERIYATRTPLD
jgi:hypothetical protein